VPEVTETVRSEADQFVLLGCDGVWERYVHNSQKMVQLVLQLRTKHEGPQAIDKLFGQLVAKDSKDPIGYDNMTALLLEFL
jgi:serine/threonine protein phosphatase PrpC